MPTYQASTEWMRADDWNYAHRVTVDGRVLCQPSRYVMPLPRKATEDDPKCGDCSKIVGTSTL